MRTLMRRGAQPQHAHVPVEWAAAAAAAAAAMALAFHCIEGGGCTVCDKLFEYSKYILDKHTMPGIYFLTVDINHMCLCLRLPTTLTTCLVRVMKVAVEVLARPTVM
jgi:hypothetical protein